MFTKQSILLAILFASVCGDLGCTTQSCTSREDLPHHVKARFLVPLRHASAEGGKALYPEDVAELFGEPQDCSEPPYAAFIYYTLLSPSDKGCVVFFFFGSEKYYTLGMPHSLEKVLYFPDYRLRDDSETGIELRWR